MAREFLFCFEAVARICVVMVMLIFWGVRAPPGARYDPVGPGDGPPNLRGGTRFPRGGGGFGTGGPPNPFGGFGEGDFI